MTLPQAWLCRNFRKTILKLLSELRPRFAKGYFRAFPVALHGISKDNSQAGVRVEARFFQRLLQDTPSGFARDFERQSSQVIVGAATSGHFLWFCRGFRETELSSYCQS